MIFCKNCGSILVPKKEGDKTILICSCGYKSESKEAGRIKETMRGKVSKIEVVDSEDNLKVLPKMKAECPKCHNDEAYFWEVQTRAADEPTTKFLKCSKCKHTWRDYN